MTDYQYERIKEFLQEALLFTDNTLKNHQIKRALTWLEASKEKQSND